MIRRPAFTRWMSTRERSETPIPPDSSRLKDAPSGAWSLDGDAAARRIARNSPELWRGTARFVDTPFGKGVSLDGNGDSVMVPGPMRRT